MNISTATNSSLGRALKCEIGYCCQNRDPSRYAGVVAMHFLLKSEKHQKCCCYICYHSGGTVSFSTESRLIRLSRKYWNKAQMNGNIPMFSHRFEMTVWYASESKMQILNILVSHLTITMIHKRTQPQVSIQETLVTCSWRLSRTSLGEA